MSRNQRAVIKGDVRLCAKQGAAFEYEGNANTCQAGFKKLPFKKVDLGSKPGFTLNIK